MANEIITHSIGDNKLIIADRETGEPVEYIGLGVDRIITGIENPNRREILTDPISGYNYSRNAVEAQEIYNSKTKKRGNWFILELCTGQYGWFPGCEIRADTTTIGTLLYKEPSTDSDVLYTFEENSSVEIIDILNLEQMPENSNWRKVKYLTEGYIEASKLTNFRYAKPGFAG
jgi:hypothetical protein